MNKDSIHTMFFLVYSVLCVDLDLKFVEKPIFDQTYMEIIGFFIRIGKLLGENKDACRNAIGALLTIIENSKTDDAMEDIFLDAMSQNIAKDFADLNYDYAVDPLISLNSIFTLLLEGRDGEAYARFKYGKETETRPIKCLSPSILSSFDKMFGHYVKTYSFLLKQRLGMCEKQKLQDYKINAFQRYLYNLMKFHFYGKRPRRHMS